jgi:hypothetical protein
MMQTKYVIQMRIPTRPDLDYFYRGQNKEGCPVFELKKIRAKRYTSFEEAHRDMRILFTVEGATTGQVVAIRCRT